MARFMSLADIERAASRERYFPAARNGIVTRDCVRRQKKKGVRLWLFAMAKG
jgi:hypothetical protein